MPSSDTQTRLVVSIINYRTRPLTIACARSVLDDITQQNAHVVIVDNASDDGSADDIAQWINTLPPDTPIELLRSERNAGFSGGHNITMRHHPADFYLLLNSDAVLRAGFCDALLSSAARHTDAGLIAVRLEDEDGTGQNSLFRFASPTNEFIRAVHTGVVTRLLKHRDIPLGPVDTKAPESQHIEWASFACIALRGDMVKEIGLMDEGYFLYFEDAEYCLRARRAGWLIVTEPDAVAVHYRGGSGPVKALQKAKKRMPEYFYASRSRFLYQAHGRLGLLFANLLWHLGRGLAQFRRLAGKRVPLVAENEARDIWINAFDPLGPRRAPGDIDSGH